MLYLALYVRFAGESEVGGESVPPGGIVGAVAIYLYAFGWSFGHSVACYIVAAEIFPARIVSYGEPKRNTTLSPADCVYSVLSPCLSACLPIGS